MAAGGCMADLTGRMVGAMKADVPTLTEIENDPAAFGQAITVIVIAGIASLIGNIFRAGIGAGIFGLVSSIVWALVFALFVYLIGVKVMPEPSTKADFNETFRCAWLCRGPRRLQRPGDHPDPRGVHIVRPLDLDVGDRRRRHPGSARLLEHRARDYRWHHR